jgi:hypothetical protein
LTQSLLLILCGVLEAIISVVYLVVQNADTDLGKLAVAAGACAVAAGILKPTERSWLLVLNGLALSSLGMIQWALVRFPISFLTIALLISAMAVSIGILDIVDGWFFGAIRVISVGFALTFLALGLRWIRIEPGSRSDLLWIGSYFGFSAICMVALALKAPAHSSGQSHFRSVS